MLRHVLMLLVAGGALCAMAGDLFAQAQGFGSSISGGGLGVGQGSSSGSSLGGSSSGAGGTSSSTGGLNMLNASTLSGSFGVLGFGAANGFSQGTGGSSMYGGRNYGSVTSAGGATSTSSTTGSRTSSTSTSSTSTAGRGGASTAASGGSRRRGGPTEGTAAKQPVWFEPRIEVGFDVPSQRTSAVATTLAAALGANKAGSRFGGVRVAVDGQTAILRGVVASQNDRQLAESITLLDPSITNVRNELIIQRSRSSTR